MASHREQDFNTPRQRQSTSPKTTSTTTNTRTNDSSKNNGGGSGGLAFIVGNTPAEMKSKQHMTIVRKAAMRSYLKQSKDKKPRGTQLKSEDFSRSHSSPGSQSASFTNTASQLWINSSGIGGLHGTRQSSTAGTPVLKHGQHPLALDTNISVDQEAHEKVFEAAPIVIPSRSNDRGGKLPYDRRDIPLFVSLGKGVDPFKMMFQSSYPRVSVENLKFLCARFFGTRAMGQHWIPTILSAPHTFLSTLCIASAHYDAILERDVESVETTSLRQEIVHLVGQNVVHPDTPNKINDHNMTTLIQLIASEVIAREEVALHVHEAGLEAMVNMRGGLNQLGVAGYLASTISWVLLESAILRETQPHGMFLDYSTAHSVKNYPHVTTIPESPIYRPRRQFDTLKKSNHCKILTLDLLNDVQMMIEILISQNKSTRRDLESISRLYENIINYPSIADIRNTRNPDADDYKYEVIRLTAILQATAILECVSLSDALSQAAAAAVRSLTSTYTFAVSTHPYQNSASPTSPMNPRHDSTSSSVMLPTYASNSSFVPSIFSDHGPRSSISSIATSRPSLSSTISHPSMSSTTTHPSVSSDATSRPSMSSTSESWPFLPLNSSRPSMRSAHSLSNNPFFMPATTTSATTSFLTSIKEAICSSNMSDCWKDMAGVLLWIGLTIGAASRKHESRALKKWFSALSMRVSIVLCFEHPEAVHATMLKMGEVVEALRMSDIRSAVSSMVEKKRKSTD